METNENRKALKTEPLLGGLALLLLLAGCFYVLKPFSSAILWAIILTFSLHPLQKKFTQWFRGSKTLAACLVTLMVLLVIAGPFVVVGISVAKDGKELAIATKDWFLSIPDTPPKWISKAPVIGEELGTYWSDIAADRKRWIEQLDKEVESPIKNKTIEDDNIRVTPHTELLPGYAEQIQAESADKTTAKPNSESSPIIAMLGRFLAWARTGLIAVGLTVGQGVTQILISTFLAFFLLRDSPQLASRLNVTVERLAGDRGRQLIKVAGNTVSGVIYGILGTAIAQAIVAGIGFTIAGIPGAVLLSVLTFFFAVIPFGPPLIWLPATIWLFANEKHGLSLFMLLWGIFVISSVDNLLRPYLISQGTKLPFALIFCGVIGGALAFGLVGVFLGPTLLAVAFRLIEEWSSEKTSITSESPAASI
ncbi:MAG: AI-2E family transporter [Verrucomicrobia bacterium]|nr:AI-2E family transporter [Verrucomicrobiota bacterium]